jgi:hypothetical protein
MIHDPLNQNHLSITQWFTKKFEYFHLKIGLHPICAISYTILIQLQVSNIQLLCSDLLFVIDLLSYLLCKNWDHILFVVFTSY